MTQPFLPPAAIPTAGTGAGRVDPRLADLLAELTAAGTLAEAADAAVRHAVTLTGARGGALALLTPGGTRLRIVASRGYGCTSMAAGATLDADAGLPITKAAATGTAVVVPDGWIAVPLAPAPRTQGALLVSAGPVRPDPADDARLVTAIAGHVRTAFDRIGAAATQPVPLQRDVRDGGLEAALWTLPLQDRGGDAVDLWAVDGGHWLLLADASGADTTAAAAALATTVGARALSTSAASPAALLGMLDDLLTAAAPADRFVSVTAVRLQPVAQGLQVTFAAAGHPGAVVASDGTAHRRPVPAAPPLNLGLGGTTAAHDDRFVLRYGETLLLHTDGLVRRRSWLADEALLGCVRPAVSADDAAGVAHAVSESCRSVGGPARDDAALAVVRPLPYAR